MAAVAVRIRGLKKFYGALPALDDISFDISAGEILGLLGPNGAGKTTLISILGGLVRPSAGSAVIHGFDVVDKPLAARREIGIVPQETVYDPFFTVRQYLRQQSSYYGLQRNDDWIDELLLKLHLNDKAETNTRKLSGGMKRRLVIAMALVHKPSVVVLDEPTAGIDVDLRRSLWKFIRELNQAGTTVLLTTHYLNEAEVLCGRIVLMDKGHILANEATVDLLKPGRHSRHCLRLRLVGNNVTLPAEVANWLSPNQDLDNGRYSMLFDSYEDLEKILAILRQQKVAIADLDIVPPDLEDAFFAIINKVRN